MPRFPFCFPRTTLYEKQLATQRKATGAEPDDLTRALHALADAAVPAILEDVAAALASVGISLEKAALLRLLEAGQRSEIEQAIRAAWATVGERGLQATLAPRLEALALEAASLTPIATVSIRFNVQDPEALRAIAEYAGAQIVQISTTTREAIQGILTRAFESGTPLTQQIAEIAEIVGLTDQQASSLAKLRGELVAAGETPGAVQPKVAERAALMRRQRAEMISRTESISAISRGQHERTMQAIRDGLLDEARVKRVWRLGPRACVEVCQPIPGMNPGGVGVNEPFQTPVGPVMYPTAHPGCMCAVNQTVAP